MTLESFEEQITKGKAQWIVSFEYIEDTNRITIGLTHDTENFSTEQNLIFNNVESLNSDWHDKEDNCIESIISATEELTLTKYQYYFYTDQREIFIRTTEKIIIECISDKKK